MALQLLSLYLKLNLLLALTLALWWLLKTLPARLSPRLRYQEQLRIARVLFAGALCVPCLLLLSNLLPQHWQLLSLTLLQPLYSESFTFVANLDQSLNQPIQVRGLALPLSAIVASMIVSCLVLKFYKLWRQVRYLRHILNTATESKHIHGVHVLYADGLSTPFSTRALGKKCVVLPSQLLHSPSHLRLALKHELQHLRNHDLEWILLLELVQILCCWNPAVWLWHNEFDCLQEFACDEVLIAQRQVNAHAYGACLLEVASSQTTPALLAASHMVPTFSWLQNPKTLLHRRILMLQQKRSPQHNSLKKLSYLVLAAAGLLQTSLWVFAADGGAAPDKNVIPLERVAPNYPPEALSAKMEGWVLLDFTIDTDGSTKDIKVIDKCSWTEGSDASKCTPATTFDDVAVAAFSQWKYQGADTPRKNVQTMLRFTLKKE